MPHPYEELEGTPLWRAVAAAVDDLVTNGDLQLTAAREHVVGYLCQRLVAAGFAGRADIAPAAMTAARFADFLDRSAAAGIGGADWQEHVAVHHADAQVEEARRQAALIGLRVAQGGLAAEQAGEYLRALARGLRDRAG